MTRQIILDTETTGLEPEQGHRIIEIGCVEIINRRPTGRTLHLYFNPQRDVDQGAIEVHGITNEFLADKPLFGDKAAEILEFLRGAELVIHNAAFDIGFLNHEFRRADPSFSKMDDHCGVLDTLLLARKLHPGQKNNLDALCKRYDIDNSHRELHGALLDAEILRDVYLLMTGGQSSLSLSSHDNPNALAAGTIKRLSAHRARLVVVSANADELTAHEARLQAIDKSSGGKTLWRQLETKIENAN